jgi:predicted transcriptional regulator
MALYFYGGLIPPGSQGIRPFLFIRVQIMNIKQIAELTGKTEKTIRQWISQEQKVLTQEQKVLIKGHSKDYDLDSVISILKSGKVSDSLISLLIENVKNKMPDDTNSLMFLLRKSVLNTDRIIELFDKRLSLIESNQPKQIESDNKQKQIESSNNQKQIESNKQTMTVNEYISQNKITSFNMAGFVIQIGKQLTRLSKELHRNIGFKREGNFDVGLYDEDLFTTALIIAKKMIEKDNVLFKD